MRHGERRRYEERTRAFDIIEQATFDADEAVAEALWRVAASIMRDDS
jgi:hypothetical protein